MKELIRHIERLLPEHDCVVVPGLGGFVQNEVSARFDLKSDIFYPEGKEICFNAKLTFNDGFLAQSYQENQKLSFEESNQHIRQGVQELLFKLDEGKYVSLGQIGVLWKSNEGQICFRSENRNSFCPDAYGLTSFSYPTLEKRLRKKSYVDYQLNKRKEEEFINIRFRRNSFRNFLTGAAACLFLLFLSEPAGNLPQNTDQQAFLMHNYISAPMDIESNPRTKNNPFPEIKAADTVATVAKKPEKKAETKLVIPFIQKKTVLTKRDSIKNEKKAAKLKAKIKAAEKKNEIAPEKYNRGGVLQQTIDSNEENQVVEKKNSNKPSNSYYVVVGSFPDRQSAKEWIKAQSANSVLKKAGIVESEGRARVYSRSFPDKDQATAYLNQFRADNPDYATAWLLNVKK